MDNGNIAENNCNYFDDCCRDFQKGIKVHCVKIVKRFFFFFWAKGSACEALGPAWVVVFGAVLCDARRELNEGNEF